MAENLGRIFTSGRQAYRKDVGFGDSLIFRIERWRRSEKVSRAAQFVEFVELVSAQFSGHEIAHDLRCRRNLTGSFLAFSHFRDSF